jgi:rare lipoprotein A
MLKKLGLILALTAAVVTGSAVAASAEVGIASHYDSLRITASGRSYSAAQAGIAAHKTIPLGSIVKVTRLSTGRSLIVRIVDRGPYIRGRIIDLTPAGARRLGFEESGLTKVRVDVIKMGNTHSWLKAHYGRGPNYAEGNGLNRALGGAPSKKKRASSN